MIAATATLYLADRDPTAAARRRVLRTARPLHAG